MNLEGFKTWAHDLGTFVHIKKPNELDVAATETLIKSATGIAPNDEEAAHLVQLAGAKVGGWGNVKPGEIFSGAPKNSDDLIHNIGDAVKSGLQSMLLNWKDKHFPAKLDGALDQQAGVLTKLRKVVAELDLQATTVQQTRDGLKTGVDKLDAQIAAASDQATKDRLTIIKNQQMTNINTMDTKLIMVNKTKADFESQLSTLETKHEFDKQNAIVLKSEWKLNRQLKDLPEATQKSYESMINLGQDADRISREINEREAAARAALDEALKHGVPVTGA